MGDAQPSAPTKRTSILGTVTEVLGGAAVLFLMVQTVGDALLRRIPGVGYRGGLDIIQYWWMPAISFFGLAIAQWRNEHIEVSLVFDLLSERAAAVVARAIQVLVIAVMAVIAVAGIEHAWSRQLLGETSGATGIMIWPPRYFIPIGAALYIWALLGGGKHDVAPTTVTEGSGRAATAALEDEDDAP